MGILTQVATIRNIRIARSFDNTQVYGSRIFQQYAGLSHSKLRDQIQLLKGIIRNPTELVDSTDWQRIFPTIVDKSFRCLEMPKKKTCLLDLDIYHILWLEPDAKSRYRVVVNTVDSEISPVL